MSDSKGDMMHFYKSFLLFWLILSGLQNLLHAQDPTYSQFFANQLQLNPAMTGFDGGTTVHTQYRNQWARIAGRDAEFTTRAVTMSVEMPCWNSAMGVFAQSNTEGEGYLQWNQVGVSYAYRSRPPRASMRGTNDVEINLGLSISYNWFSIQWDRLIFSDQLDAFDGLTGNPSAFQPASLDAPAASFFDVSAGGMLVFQDKFKNQTRIGLSLHHVTSPDYSIIGNDAILPLRLSFHASHIANKDLNEKFSYQLIPLMKIDWQTIPVVSRDRPAPGADLFGTGIPYLSMSIGALASIRKDPKFWGGLMLQGGLIDLDQDRFNNIYSLVLIAGYEYPLGGNSTARIGISHDFNFTALRSDGLGTTEIALTVNFGDAHIGRCNRRPRRSWICPAPI